MRKTALAIALVLSIFISIVAGMQVVKVAEANPWWLFDFTATPNIKLGSPLNKTDTGNVLLDFTVTASRDWVTGTEESQFRYSPEIFQELNSVDYYIDGSLRGSLVANNNLSSPFHYSASLTDLQEGSHCLMVGTHSTGVSGGYIAGGISKVLADSSSVTVYFSVVSTILPTPAPTPTLTPEPTVTPYEEANVQNTSQYVVTGGTVALASIIIFLGLLFYFIKRK